jgi:hypothetical protein
MVHFHHFQNKPTSEHTAVCFREYTLDGWVARWMDGWMDRWTDGWMSGWMDEEVDE